MQLADFDFDLPEDRIALRPASPRDAARLLVVRAGRAAAGPARSATCPALLRAGDVLVLNDTRVIPARLKGVRARDESRVAVEATLHRRLAPHALDRLHAARQAAGARATGSRSARAQDRACLLGALDATVKEKGEGGEVTLAFDLSGPDLDAAIAERGAMPLPPYIAAKRAEDEQDRADYQTVYARGGRLGGRAHGGPALHAGAAGAAGRGRASRPRFVTLHVGAGTFLPVKTETVAEHRMHAEWGEVDAATAERAERRARRRAAGSSASAPPRCGCWRSRDRRGRRGAAVRRARPRSSSPRATASAPPTG